MWKKHTPVTLNKLFNQDEEERVRDIHQLELVETYFLATQSLAGDLLANIGKSMHEALGDPPLFEPPKKKRFLEYIEDITKIPAT